MSNSVRRGEGSVGQGSPPGAPPGGEPPVGDSPGGVQSVDRAISVLEILARRGTAGVTEIAAEIGVHKSTAFRLLGALESRRLVEQLQGRGKYQLGFGILRLAGAVPGRPDLVRQAHGVCSELAARFGETVNLAVVRSHFAVNLDQVRGPAAVASQNWVGELTPLHATSSGKILLAYAPADQVAALLDAAGLERYTAQTVTSRSLLDAELARARADGYAATFEEYEQGLTAVAAPIRDDSGEVVAAVSVSGPAYRLDRARVADIVGDLVAGAGQISERMGHLA